MRRYRAIVVLGSIQRYIELSIECMGVYGILSASYVFKDYRLLPEILKGCSIWRKLTE